MGSEQDLPDSPQAIPVRLALGDPQPALVWAAFLHLSPESCFFLRIELEEDTLGRSHVDLL